MTIDRVRRTLRPRAGKRTVEQSERTQRRTTRDRIAAARSFLTRPRPETRD